jgi:hypothetical protein
MTPVANWAGTAKGAMEYDMKGTYLLGMGMGGDIPILKNAQMDDYTIKIDDDGSGALHTLLITRQGTPAHQRRNVKYMRCPSGGCWPPPQLPPDPIVVKEFSLWSHRRTWFNTTYDTRNPLNKIEIDVAKSTIQSTVYKIVEKQEWAADTPSDFDNVWIPKWRHVVLDMSSPILGRLVIEGTLLINASTMVNLTATWIEIKGGSLIIAKCDSVGNILGPFEGRAHISLLGTNQKLALKHGRDPRQTPELVLGKQALSMAPAVLGVMGTFIAKVHCMWEEFEECQVSLRHLPGFVRAHILRVHVWIVDGGRKACVSN